jgi:aminoglycoside phosphotransferase (APT) family kinase protein
MSQDFSGTKPVSPRLAFDVDRLEGYLREHVAGFSTATAPLAVEQFKGGQSNPTYLLSAGGRRYVLRRKPPGKLLASAHAVDREYRVITALAGSGVPVPRTDCLCRDAAVIGTEFYVMEYVEGRILWDPTLPGMTHDERAAIFDEMNRVLAALHDVDYTAVGLGDYGKPGNYFARQIDRWTRQIRASHAQPTPAMERLIEWLPEHVPPGDETTIVHGDYRLDNLVFHATEPRVLAVLDWELSTLGHPLADLAYHCMAWHIPLGMLSGLRGADLAALGIPDEADYVARYCRRRRLDPIDPDDWDFYMAYNLFRAAAILQGILGRAKDGTAASAQALTMGQMAAPFAELAWQQVEDLARRRKGLE